MSKMTKLSCSTRVMHACSYILCLLTFKSIVLTQFDVHTSISHDGHTLFLKSFYDYPCDNLNRGDDGRK